ncbi:MAG TPA: hypothetical protein VIJ34_01455 [Acidimicrobiales bacterium]
MIEYESLVWMIETSLDGLVGAFQSPPSDATDLEHWPYCWAKFETAVHGRRLEFEIRPADSSARIRLSSHDDLLADIALDEIRAISVENRHGITALRFLFRRTEHLLHLRLRPNPLILWPATGSDSETLSS